MDGKNMARHLTYLATRPVPATSLLVTIILLTLLFPAPALGQGATCPDYTNALVPIPAGNWPGTMALCVEPGGAGGVWSVEYADGLPCDSAVRFLPDLLNLNDHPVLTVVPPAAMEFTSGAGKLSFLFQVFSAPFGQPYSGTAALRIETFTGAGQRTGSTIVNTSDYTMTRADFDSDLNRFGYAYYWAITDVDLAMQTGGYFTVQVVEPSIIQVRDYYFESFRLNDVNLGYPDMCELPGGLPPAPPTPTATNTPTPSTPTNTPTYTPTGTYEPTETPTNQPTPTFEATSPGGTFTPVPSSTPQAFSTIASPSTPTPFPGQILPTLVVPTIQLPAIGDMATAQPIDMGLTPNATTEVRITQISEWVSQTEIISNGWMTTTDQAIGWLDPGVTTTTGISSPVQIRDEMVSNIARPIGIFRGLSLYVPNLWPYLLLMFFMLAWVIFILLVKFGVAIISESMELLRKVWEAIPFIN